MKKKLEKQGGRRVRAPRGFHFQIVVDQYSTRILLKESKNPDRPIGYVNLVKVNNKNKQYYETHSGLNQEYWNRGLGAAMYAKAIQWCLDNGHKVRSSGASSGMAKRVWNGQKIRQYFFRIRKTDNQYHNPVWLAYR